MIRVAILALFLTCDGPAERAEPVPAAPTPSPEVEAKEVQDPVPVPVADPVAAPSLPQGPLGNGASAEERRDAVLALLAGGSVAADLPEHTSPPGIDFDPGLERAMTPTAPGSVRVPRVRQAGATVTGALDRDVVRRIVRAHINEVRYCYNLALRDNPNARGMVEIAWAVDAAGKVKTSAVTKSAIKGPIRGCLAKAVKRWKFPKPGDGDDVQVAYKFNLQPG